MAQGRKRTPSEILKRGYSDEEVVHIYELGRLCLENGDIRRAEAIMAGITEIAPDFAPAWLGMSYIHTQNHKNEEALNAAKQAHRVDPELPESILYLIACLLTSGDYNSAGTYLGEISEKIDSGIVDYPHFIRFYKMQLARYQNR